VRLRIDPVYRKVADNAHVGTSLDALYSMITQLSSFMGGVVGVSRQRWRQKSACGWHARSGK
jgi:hypothetical protein